MKSGKLKGRSSKTFANKRKKIENWYKKRQKFLSQEPQINKNTKQQAKRKQLRPLEFYIDKIKKPNFGGK